MIKAHDQQRAFSEWLDTGIRAVHTLLGGQKHSE